jgi:hypothetical protein
MMAGDSRSYYKQIPVIPSSIFNPQPISQVASRAADGEDMARLLQEQQVTHFFVNVGETQRTGVFRRFPWDQRAWAVFERLLVAPCAVALDKYPGD